MPTLNQVHVNRPLSSPQEPVEQAEIDLTPPETVRNAARRGLELRRKWGRGGLSTAEAGEQGIGSGVARATSLANGQKVSPETISMMVRFFSRHKQNYQPDKRESDGGPTAGTISHYLWGGPAADQWSRKIYDQLQERKVKKVNPPKPWSVPELVRAIEQAGGNMKDIRAIYDGTADQGYYVDFGDWADQKTIDAVKRLLKPLEYEMEGPPPRDKPWVQIWPKNEIARPPFFKANHSRSHCMLCKQEAPTIDVLWSDGQRRAWFCKSCFAQWSQGKSIVMSNQVEGQVPARFKKLKHSPREAKKVNTSTTFRINGHKVTLGQLAKAWLAKSPKFVDTPWSDPAPNLSTEDYAKVTLINMNPPGKEPVKNLYKLPVKSTPTGPYNRNALRAAAAALQGARGGVQAPDEAKRTAARKLVRLMGQAGIEAGNGIRQLAGLKVEKAEVWEIPIAKADEERRVVYGVALKPFEADSQKDRIEPAEIEQAAWGFMKYLGKGQGRMDYQHEKILPLDQAYPVESYITPQDMTLGTELVPKGSWVMAVHVPDDKLWQMVKSGEINGFSIRGTGRRTAAGTG